MSKESLLQTSWVLIPPQIMGIGDLPIGAKVVFGRIFALCQADGTCNAFNGEISQGIGYTKDTVSQYVMMLVKRKLIRIKLTRDENQMVIDRKIWIPFTDVTIPENTPTPSLITVRDPSLITVREGPYYSPNTNNNINNKYIYINTNKVLSNKDLSSKNLSIIGNKSNKVVSEKKLNSSPIELAGKSSLTNDPVEQKITSKNAILPLTSMEVWEMAKTLDVPLRHVKETDRNFWYYIENPKNRKKYKTSYKTIKRWIEIGLSKGTIEHCNETEKLELLEEHPDRVQQIRDTWAWAKEKGIIE